MQNEPIKYLLLKSIVFAFTVSIGSSLLLIMVSLAVTKTILHI